MELVGMLVTGLVIGALARLVVPGTAGLGCIPTVAVGVGGAFLGGLLGRQLVGGSQGGLLYLLFSVLGAVLILLLLQAIAGRRR